MRDEWASGWPQVQAAAFGAVRNPVAGSEWRWSLKVFRLVNYRGRVALREIALPEGTPGGGLGFVGSSYCHLTALDGRLYLGFNDYYVDNSFQGSTSSREGAYDQLSNTFLAVVRRDFGRTNSQSR